MAATPSPAIRFPGDIITERPTRPASETKAPALKLGPGLTHTPPATITAHTVGYLIPDHKKNALWLESDTRRYIPAAQDRVIATVLRSSADSYICAIASSTSAAPSTVQATLPHLAFPQATKKTRPILAPGATVYARVSVASKHMDPELECFDAETGKANGLGELKGGMVFSVSLGTARRLLGDGKKIRRLMGGDEAGWEGTGQEVMEELGKSLQFEMAVGRNGRVWVDSEDVRTTLCVGRCVVNSQGLTVEEVKEMVRREVGKLNNA